MNSLKTYKRNSKLVNKESEVSLWNAYVTTRDRDIHEKLVELYLPLVYKEVSKLSIRVRQKMEKDELVSAGVIGLHNAVVKFQPNKGNQFSTFAVTRIKVQSLMNFENRTTSQDIKELIIEKFVKLSKDSQIIM